MNTSISTTRWTRSLALLAGAVTLAATVPAASIAAQGPSGPTTSPSGGAAGPADRGRDRARLVEQVKVPAIMDHLQRLEQIGDRYGDRASGRRGYLATRNYVVRTLEQAGYRPQVQAFQFPYFTQTGPSVFEQVSPTSTTYEEENEYFLMEYSGSGDTTAPVEGVDLALGDLAGSTSGCEAADFDGFTIGNIALVRRGGCTFDTKVTNAENAGATAVIVMNQGTVGRTDAFQGTLGGTIGEVPSIGTSFAIGQALAAEPSTARVAASTESDIRTTWNVIAQTEGSPRNVVMAGAHLDSVQDANGINDNGSGSAALLEVAEQLAKHPEPNNQVRMAWWGAEESGLLGSEHYVDDLVTNRPRAFQRIALYLNYDMVASPNYALMVYDGDNSTYGPDEGAEIGPEGSGAIERMFHRFFAREGSASDESPFNGRSDYGPFIAQNVPAGGLFTGAEGVKTPDQEVKFGGEAGEAYDTCYHLPCDNLANLSLRALRFNSRAMAHAVTVYKRSTRSVNGDSTGHEPPEPTASRRSHQRHRHAGDPVAR